MRYNGEIDDLSALAIMPIVLFHAGFEIFGDCYINVDIFFVISGYLITSIIFRVKKDTFSIKLLKPYAKYIRKIYFMHQKKVNVLFLNIH